MATVTQESKMSTAIIEVPIGEHNGGYEGRSVNIHLTGRQSRALKLITAGLDGEMHSVKRGSMEVEKPGHAIKWLLDRIADEIE